MIGFELGIIIGAFPTVAMIIAILLLTNIEVGHKMEAALQNLAAGLILAAVASELFPIMVDGSRIDVLGGISIGFVVGLGTIYGVEFIIEKLEELGGGESDEESAEDDQGDEEDNLKTKLLVKTMPKDFDELAPPGTKEVLKVQFDEAHVEASTKAIAKPEHRNHLRGHLEELIDSIKFMKERADALSNPDLSVQDSEDIAESIDEKIHSLQYNLDHARRLLQYSEGGQHKPLSEDRKALIRKGLAGLQHSVEHIVEHLDDPRMDKHAIHEIRVHMDLMDKQIASFHESIEHVGMRWGRLHLPDIEPMQGDALPLGLVLPVCMDGFVDGFLIGISASISFKAGIVLSAANCMEMSFLGMAYAARLNKCTGSSKCAVFCALYAPAILMLIAAGLGAAIGELVQSIPMLFIALVSFGAVALLFLVCNELLIEARETQGSEEKWYITIMIFLGIYIVLLLDLFL